MNSTLFKGCDDEVVIIDTAPVLTEYHTTVSNEGTIYICRRLGQSIIHETSLGSHSSSISGAVVRGPNTSDPT